MKFTIQIAKCEKDGTLLGRFRALVSYPNIEDAHWHMVSCRTGLRQTEGNSLFFVTSSVAGDTFYLYRLMLIP